VQYEFLQALEETGCLGKSTGWYPCYFLVKRVEADSVVAEADSVAEADGSPAEDKARTDKTASDNSVDGQLIAA